MRELLITAIQRRQLVTIIYEPGERIIEPHALGFGSNGQLLLRAFQVGGVSASGEHVNWKLFRLDRLKAANNNGHLFEGPRPGYKQNDKAMSGGIIRQL